MTWREWMTRHGAAAALAAMACLLIAPLWCVRIPEMPDYPAHMASFWLIGGGASRYYHLDWQFIPNLASEASVPLLAHLTGLDVAARLFLSVTVAMWVLGPAAVQRALTGHIGAAPLLGAFFAYNANFFWGFFNYDFAAGLSLLVFAGWIASERAPAAARRLGFALAATVVYFCHLFAAVALLAMIAGYEMARGSQTRDLLRRALGLALIFLPSAFAFLVLKPASAGDANTEFHLRKRFIDRLESLILHRFDLPAHLLPALLALLLLAALLTGRARLVPVMLPGLALLLLGAMLAPETAMGGWGVDLRLPALFATLLFASARTRLGAGMTLVVAAGALAVAGWTSAALVKDWRAYDRQVSEFRTALKDLPLGTKLVTVLDGAAIGEASDPPYWHLAEWAVIDRGALTGLLFTTRGQHVVRTDPPHDRDTAATAQQGSPPDIGELDDLAAGRVADDDIRDIFPYLMYFPCHYDEALVIHLGGRRDAVPGMLRLRHQGSFFSLYDIRAGRSCAGR